MLQSGLQLEWNREVQERLWELGGMLWERYPMELYYTAHWPGWRLRSKQNSCSTCLRGVRMCLPGVRMIMGGEILFITPSQQGQQPDSAARCAVAHDCICELEPPQCWFKCVQARAAGFEVGHASLSTTYGDWSFLSSWTISPSCTWRLLSSGCWAGELAPFDFLISLGRNIIIKMLCLNGKGWLSWRWSELCKPMRSSMGRILY